MKKCSKCQYQGIDKKAKYCPNCGNSLIPLKNNIIVLIICFILIFILFLVKNDNEDVVEKKKTDCSELAKNIDYEVNNLINSSNFAKNEENIIKYYDNGCHEEGYDFLLNNDKNSLLALNSEYWAQYNIKNNQLDYAIENYNKCLNYWTTTDRSTNKNTTLFAIYTGLGYAYHKKGINQKAIEYFKKALVYFNPASYSVSAISGKTRLDNIVLYEYMGDAYYELKNILKAKECYGKALLLVTSYYNNSIVDKNNLKEEYNYLTHKTSQKLLYNPSAEQNNTPCEQSKDLEQQKKQQFNNAQNNTKNIDKNAKSSNVQDIQNRVKENYYPPVNNKGKQVILLLRVAKNGSVISCRIYRSSGLLSLDQAALDAIKMASPFGNLPDNYKDINDFTITFKNNDVYIIRDK